MPAQQATPGFELVEYERKWVEALNRGDASGADDAFAPDCVIHITGAPAPDGCTSYALSVASGGATRQSMVPRPCAARNALAWLNGLDPKKPR